jgi:hypothetical protein
MLIEIPDSTPVVPLARALASLGLIMDGYMAHLPIMRTKEFEIPKDFFPVTEGPSNDRS